jgi:hypothetical protein
VGSYSTANQEEFHGALAVLVGMRVFRRYIKARVIHSLSKMILPTSFGVMEFCLVSMWYFPRQEVRTPKAALIRTSLARSMVFSAASWSMSDLLQPSTVIRVALWSLSSPRHDRKQFICCCRVDSRQRHKGTRHKVGQRNILTKDCPLSFL